MTTQLLEPNDESLVAESLAGDRTAYGRIVQRYQSLICGITYAASGDVHRSEDLAQETFIQAWRNLVTLKDRGRLRWWLCGIARNLISDDLRRRGRQPAANQEVSEQMEAEAGVSPAEEAISKEEQSLIWAALERLPIKYREPMVLYYRQEESIATTAAALDLTEEAARQRLTRGRAMLADRLDRILGRGLRDSAPTSAFAMGVMSALPIAAVSAKASALGAVVKGSAAAKTVAAGGLMSAAILGPFLGLLGSYAGYRRSMSQLIAPQERRLLRWCMGGILLLGIALITLLMFTVTWSRWLALTHADVAIVLTTAVLLYAAAIVGCVILLNRALRRLRARLIAEQPDLAERAKAISNRLAFEYCSRWKLLGVPLVHINTGARVDARPRAAFGWIAFGGKAYGLLFAIGAIAIAPISFGGIAVGLITLGGLGAGLLVWGGFAIGVWSIGGLAIGYKAFGACALGWSASQGAIAVAHGFAEGAVASAQHANDPAAHAMTRSDPFFRLTNGLAPYANLIWLLYFLPMIPILIQMRRRAKGHDGN